MEINRLLKEQIERILLCKKAAEKLGLQFKFIINEQQLTDTITIWA